MKKILSLAFGLLLAVAVSADEVSTFQGLVKRVLRDYPHLSTQITGKLLPQKGADYFTLSSGDGKVVVGGNSANSMAVGFNYYLKYYCNTTVSWFVDDGLGMPDVLPEVPQPVTIKARVKDRFFLNYCTFGYTMPWWSWRDWEHFIDWMALQGVNLPLAITGQESIWHKVWMKLGLKDEEVRHYFTGPAHLPWHRMLNIDYWQGDLPMSWLNDQEALQKQIVARERELNMKPVLPAFAGHVPQELKKIYPNAKITKLEPWAGYESKYACSFLDPMDPLFVTVQKEFLDQERALYGTDHIYGIDLFNELEPPSYEPAYLRRVAKQVYGTLQKVDPKAVWLQMTWLFFNERDDWTNDRVKAYITAYPKDRSILLDYYCEAEEVWRRTDKYYGVPYIWCYLGNFGGNTMLKGNIKRVNERIENTFKEGGKGFRGIGSTLEGFDCNPYMYEYVFEKAWDFDTHKNIDAWAEHLADERLGHVNDSARKAWKILLNKVYTGNAGPGNCPQINIRPTFGNPKTYYASPWISYKKEDLIQATELLLNVPLMGEKRKPIITHHYDMVNLVRQVLSDYSQTVFKAYEKAYMDKDYKTMKRREKQMMELIDDVDRLVGTEQFFLVGKWIADARKKGVNDEEKTYYERNARNLITTWGEKHALLNDYASRTLNGLTSDFYGQRYRLFFAAVDKAFLAGRDFDEDAFHEYEMAVTRFEERWWKDCLGDYPAEPRNDMWVAKRLFYKYKNTILNDN